MKIQSVVLHKVANTQTKTNIQTIGKTFPPWQRWNFQDPHHDPNTTSI